jgi:hypothetical protein
MAGQGSTKSGANALKTRSLAVAQQRRAAAECDFSSYLRCFPASPDI